MESKLSRAQCLVLLKEHAGTEMVEKHCVAVADFAVFLAKKLCERGIAVDVSLVEKAALLHDLDKIFTLHDNVRHGKESGRILREKSLLKIAPIVEKHNLDIILKSGDEGLVSWEEKIVFYADKRAVFDKIVPLEERFDYMLKKYGSAHQEAFEKIKKCKPKVEALEKEIFEAAGINE